MTSLHPGTFEFLKAINEHNTRSYFSLIKPLYTEIHDQLIDFVAQLLQRINTFDPIDIDPKKCLFRIYRDARRIKPWDQLYKSNFGFAIGQWGKSWSRPKYYVHIESWHSFFGGGVYRTSPAELKAIRYYLAAHGGKYHQVTTSLPFKKHFWQVTGASTTRHPAGIPHTLNDELVTMKQHLVYRYYTDDDMLSGDLIDKLTYDCMTIKPRFDVLNDWFDYTKHI